MTATTRMTATRSPVREPGGEWRACSRCGRIRRVNVKRVRPENLCGDCLYVAAYQPEKRCPDGR